MDHESPDIGNMEKLEARFEKKHNAQNPRSRCNNTGDKPTHSNGHAWFVVEWPTRSDQIHLPEIRYLADSQS